MKSRIYTIIAFLMIAGCFAAWEVNAQQLKNDGQPTSAAALTRARAVIAQELKNSGADVMTDRVAYSTLITFKGCIMRYRQVSVTTGQITDATVDLALLDPERVTLGGKSNLVSFVSRGKSRTIKLLTQPGLINAEATGEQRNKSGYLLKVQSDFIYVRDSGSAMRLRNALKEGVMACQP